MWSLTWNSITKKHSTELSNFRGKRAEKSRRNQGQFSKLLFFFLYFSSYFLGTVLALRDSGWYSCAAVSESGSILSRAEVNVAQNADRPPPIIQLGKETSLEYSLAMKSAKEIACPDF